MTLCIFARLANAFDRLYRCSQGPHNDRSTSSASGEHCRRRKENGTHDKSPEFPFWPATRIANACIRVRSLVRSERDIAITLDRYYNYYLSNRDRFCVVLVHVLPKTVSNRDVLIYYHINYYASRPYYIYVYINIYLFLIFKIYITRIVHNRFRLVTNIIIINTYANGDIAYSICY